MIDDENDGIAGTAAREMEEECGIKLRPSELTNLTELAGMQGAGIAPSPGGCDEHIGYLYAERSVSKSELDEMKGKLSGLRDEGECITLRVVPLKDLWRISEDNKAIWSVQSRFSPFVHSKSNE
jgi:ADP-sugar diphosphatase